MEVLKDIFVSYDIAVQLKEIGFDEPCMSYYYNRKLIIDLQENEDSNAYFLTDAVFSNLNGHSDCCSAPTYEQVFKWFREKNIISEISPIVSVVNKNIKRYIFCVYDLQEESQGIEQNNIGCITYEEARE